MFKKLKWLESAYIQKPFVRKEWGKVKERGFPDLDTEDKVNQEKWAHGRQEKLQDATRQDWTGEKYNKSKQCLGLPIREQNIFWSATEFSVYEIPSYVASHWFIFLPFQN